MPFRVLLISFALLFGACDNTIAGSVRQIDHTTPTILNIADTIEHNTSVEDAEDTHVHMDETSEDTRVEETQDTVSTAETEVVTDTIVPDTAPETIEEVDSTDDTINTEDTVTVDTRDTLSQPEVTLAECTLDADCVDEDELCFEGECVTAHALCMAHTSDHIYPELELCCVKQHPVSQGEGLCSYSMVTDEIVFYSCVEQGTSLVIEEVSCVDHDEDTSDSCDQSSGCENTPIDSDDDLFYDSEDDCPFEAEVYDFYDDWDGCPEDDQDHDGWAPPEDCDDDSTIDGPLATYCEDEFGFYVMINTYVDDLFYPDCLEDSSLIFLTDGSFFNGAHIAGQDYPGDEFDNDCDGQADEAGETGLIDCWWYELGEFVSLVECLWMTEELAD